jgi:hypothetical protein
VIREVAKAIAGGLVAGLTSLQTALDDGGVTAVEWVSAGIAALVGLGIVWAVPNQQPSTPTTPTA